MKKLSKERAIKFVGIDLAKRSFHLYAVDGEGREVLMAKTALGSSPAPIIVTDANALRPDDP